jgi:hypothetical protein
VVRELSADFDWQLADARDLVRRLAARATETLDAQPELSEDVAALRRLLEREVCAEHFADLYDDLRAGGAARARALTELLRPEEVEEPEGPRARWRGYLFRAARFYLQRWTGRHGWSPSAEQLDELARAAAEEVQLALLREVELEHGRRAFWSYLARAVERRAIDQLRVLSRRQEAVSLEALTEQRGEGAFAGAAVERDPQDATAALELTQLMDAARLGVEERFALMAGAYGLNDTEAAQQLGARVGRSVLPADIRRWRFRGREKLRRAAELDR